MTRPQLAPDVLAVDVGNTKVAAAHFTGGHLRAFYRIDARRASAARLARAWAQVLSAAAVPSRTPIVIASVVPHRTRVLVRALRARRHARLHVAAWNDPWPFALAVRNPQRVGIDRLANIAGLCARGHRDGVVVDAGTAITIDVLRAGRFVGGLILPGFELQLAALHAHTALLPSLALRGAVPRLGVDTAGAMRAGVWHVTRAGVAAVARRERAALRRRAPILATGGGGGAIALALGDPGCEDPDLQMLGLRLLAQRVMPT
jgi:type III pantothenate kinase